MRKFLTNHSHLWLQDPDVDNWIRIGPLTMQAGARGVCIYKLLRSRLPPYRTKQLIRAIGKRLWGEGIYRCTDCIMVRPDVFWKIVEGYVFLEMGDGREE